MNAIRAHWKLGALVGICLACFAAGRFSAPQPAVHQVQDEHAKADTAVKVDQVVHKAGGKTTTINFDPAPVVVNFPERRGAPADLCRPVVVPGLAEPVQVPPGERIESVTIEETGPAEIRTTAAVEAHQEQERHLDLTITPQPLPRWALQAGLEGLESRQLRLAARMRLLGPIWVELSAVPARSSVGVAAAVEW